MEAELALAKEHGFSGKTSYEMMMAVFGDKSQDRKTVPTKTLWTKETTAREPAKKPVQGQKSKLKSLGEVV